MKIIEKDNLKIVVENNIATIFTSLTGSKGRSIPIIGEIEVLATFETGSVKCYFKDEKQVYVLWGGMIRKIKSSSIEVLSSEYAKDTKNVYCEGIAIPEADPETFSIPQDSHYFAFDKNNVYAKSSHAQEGLQIWSDVDINSIAFFPPEMRYIDSKGEVSFLQSSSYFADKNHLYYFNAYFIEFSSSFNSELKADLQKRKPNADAWWNWKEEYYNSLKNINTNYFTDGKKVFFHFNKEDENLIIDYPYYFGLDSHKSYYSIIPNTDLDTLKILNVYYSKNDTSIYHITRKIDADYETFEVINQHFAKDKNGIWYNGYFVDEKIDLESFKILQLQKENDHLYSFAKDKNSIYATQFGTRIGRHKGYSTLLVALKNSDPDSFQIIDAIWAKDDNNVYCYGKIWTEIDAQTFEFLYAKDRNTSYVKDKINVYNTNGRRVIKGIDGETFVMLNEYWGKDKNVVFNFEAERIMKGLDAESFIITGENGEAEDKNFVFKFVAVTHNGKDLGHKELKKIKKKLV